MYVCTVELLAGNMTPGSLGSSACGPSERKIEP